MSEQALKCWRCNDGFDPCYCKPEPHAGTLECAPVHCVIHDVDEPEEQAYNICFECNHVYQTEAELVDTYNEVARQAEQEAEKNGWYPIEFQPVDDAEQIFFCPLCTHDW